jgi:hypothetical protein
MYTQKVDCSHLLDGNEKLRKAKSELRNTELPRLFNSAIRYPL